MQRAALTRLNAISRELETLSARRSELWEEASHGREGLAPRIDEVSRRIDELWASYRSLRSVVRHGPPEAIRDRARRESGFERDLRARRAG